jgi:hypothetical protein
MHTTDATNGARRCFVDLQGRQREREGEYENQNTREREENEQRTGSRLRPIMV